MQKRHYIRCLYDMKHERLIIQFTENETDEQEQVEQQRL